jgi:hypothetical protein
MVKHKRKYTLDFEKMDKFLADTAIAHKIFMKRIEEIRKSQLAIRQAEKTGDVSFITAL